MHVVPIVQCISAALLFSSLAAAQPASSPDTALPCIRFTAPRPGQVVDDTACTVSVDVSCPVQMVAFRAAFLSSDKINIEILPLGTLRKPPFRFVWSTVGVPNQLFDGAELQATAVLSDTSRQDAVVQGVYVFHGSIRIPRVKVPYAVSDVPAEGVPVLSFAAVDSSVKAHASLSWSEAGLFVSIGVKDGRVGQDSAGQDASRSGVEILLDPMFSSTPFPTAREYVAAFPVDGEPFRIHYVPSADSAGRFAITRTSEPLGYRLSVVRTDDGYRMQGTIPVSEFGGAMPDSAALNFVVKYLDASSAIRDLSWVSAVGNEAYSPCIWGRIILQPRELTGIAAGVFGVSLAAGFLLVFLGGQIGRGTVRRGSAPSNNATEEEKKAYDRICAEIESTIMQEELSAASVSRSLSLSSGYVKTLMKKLSGLPFAEYVAQARIELAKERLRSSRTNELFIAETCGFKNAAAMEKCFRKLCRTTPAKYREQYHVA